jgi:hypothetical protein
VIPPDITGLVLLANGTTNAGRRASLRDDIGGKHLSVTAILLLVYTDPNGPKLSILAAIGANGQRKSISN